jgi:MFS family permease
MRMIYAINWLNVGAVFASMAAEFGEGVTGLGSVTGSFFIGVALMQVPGGIMAARLGAKRVVVLGTILSSSAALGCGLAPSISAIIALRFVVGAGMALVFAPSVMLVTRYFAGGKSGVGVGLLNSTFDVGGIVALFGWAVIATVYGWRFSLVFGGVLGLGAGALVLAMVPGEGKNPGLAVKAADLKKVLFDWRIMLVGIGLLATTVSNTLVSSFMPYYLNQALGVGAGTAGAVSSLVVVPPTFSALLGGRMYDKTRRPRLLLLAFNGTSAVALVLASLNNLPAAAVTALVVGFASGIAFTVGFAAAKDLNKGRPEYDGLAIAWVNCFSLFGGFPASLVFSSVAASNGYPSAWLLGAAFCVLIGLPIIALKRSDVVRGASR